MPTTAPSTLSLHDALPIWIPAEIHRELHRELLERLDLQTLSREELGDARLRPRVLAELLARQRLQVEALEDRKSTRLNSSHLGISYAVFCLKKKKRTLRR